MVLEHLTGLVRIFQYASPSGRYHGRRAIDPGLEEVEVIVAGRGRFLVDGAFVEVGPGGMLWYYPGDIVEVTSHQAEPYNTIVFVFRTNGERQHERQTLERWRSPVECAAFCADMLKAWFTHGDADGLLSCTSYSRLAWEARQYQAASEPRLPPPVAAARSYIQQHYLNPHLEVAEIARAAKVSPSHLHLLFRTNGENTPMQVVSALRLERACLLLKSTDLPVKQVAFESGFNDFNHFCRWFRRHKGSSPGRYRAALNLNNFFYSAVLGCTLWCL